MTSTSTSRDDDDIANDINILTGFICQQDVTKVLSTDPADTIIICASQILLQAEHLFESLELNPLITKTVVLVGGKGHSTQAMYGAIAAHPKYHVLAPQLTGLPEARMLEAILENFFDLARIRSQGCKILVEDRSTNCGSNAIFTRQVLKEAGQPSPQSMMLVQDPTMMRRTIESFRKAYGNGPQPSIMGCPVIVPAIRMSNSKIDYDLTGVDATQLWPINRFLGLVLGELQRLRDTPEGYGPAGKGFIGHVEIPDAVEEAYVRAKLRLSSLAIRE
ncbi:hypothetical protein K461DRAFT_293116 [Myriangium duriaei CBS 260.36]|uniref:DUF218 domain-containing protein n=1 Tax=Myriangium duriaei CBS 260.36 TaxID=1168546 RepID=A0A9P4J8P5_9PEZI|nr:hypothetical protein K461DRAFT_293116 [Myriangium duriaei CBS 260.36]